MLTYDALIEQAKLRQMPVTKTRGILREYLQVLILKEIYRTPSGKKLFFTGGTYLRLIHNSKRFSEDLDFYANKISKKEFENLLYKVVKELQRKGIESSVQFSHWGNMYVSKLIFPAIEKFYNIVSKYSKKTGIIIKLETNLAKWKVIQESQVISGFGEIYPCICTNNAILFADKIDALIKKNRARHLYDIIFMLSNKHPVDKHILSILGIKDRPENIIMKRIQSLSKEELKRQAEQLRPFLFDEQDAELISNASDIISSLLKKNKIVLK